MQIALVNTKGGVGKSTLAVHAAAWLAEQGYRVAAVDADPQGTLDRWLARAAPYVDRFRWTTPTELLSGLPALRDGYAATIVDSPAALTLEVGAVVRLTDLVVMPLGASPIDIDASYRVARLIYEARFRSGTSAEQPRPAALVVLNRVQPRTRLAKVAAEAIQRYGFPVARHALPLRQAFIQAAEQGTVVWRLGQSGRDAASELIDVLSDMWTMARGGSGHELARAVINPATRPGPSAVAAGPQVAL